MNIPFLRKKKISTRINPHVFWITVLEFFILAFSLELVAFGWFFVRVTATLDAPADATLETNTNKINAMKKQLDAIDTAIKTRTGK